MNVARILKDKGRHVATVSPSTNLMEITKLLAQKKIGAVVVCDDEQNVQGIISERDIVRILASDGTAIFDEPVEKHMTKEVRTCVENDTVEWLMEIMTAHRFRHMPVVESGRVIGIVSIGDIVKQRIAVAEMEAALMRQYIATG